MPIPNSVQDALTDLEWKNTTIEEIEVFLRNATWEFMSLSKEKRQLNVEGCSS